MRMTGPARLAGPRGVPGPASRAGTAARGGGQAAPEPVGARVQLPTAPPWESGAAEATGSPSPVQAGLDGTFAPLRRAIQAGPSSREAANGPDGPGLPKRTRQASLTPQLRKELPPELAERQSAASERTAEQARSLLSSIQQGIRAGRAETGEGGGNGPAAPLERTDPPAGPDFRRPE